MDTAAPVSDTTTVLIPSCGRLTWMPIAAARAALGLLRLEDSPVGLTHAACSKQAQQFSDTDILLARHGVLLYQGIIQ